MPGELSLSAEATLNPADKWLPASLLVRPGLLQMVIYDQRSEFHLAPARLPLRGLRNWWAASTGKRGLWLVPEELSCVDARTLQIEVFPIEEPFFVRLPNDCSHSPEDLKAIWSRATSQ